MVNSELKAPLKFSTKVDKRKMKTEMLNHKRYQTQ